jgi:hypothetical protein
VPFDGRIPAPILRVEMIQYAVTLSTPIALCALSSTAAFTSHTAHRLERPGGVLDGSFAYS